MLYFYIGIIFYLCFLIYTFPVFELRREAIKRNKKVSLKFFSKDTFKLILISLFKLGLYGIFGSILILVLYVVPFSIYKHMTETFGLGYLVSIILNIIWLFLSGIIISGLFYFISEKLKNFFKPIEELKKNIDDLKLQPIHIDNQFNQTPLFIYKLQKLSGLERYKTLDERFPDGIIRAPKPSKLKFLLIPLLLIYLILPISLSLMLNDFNKLHIYWVIPFLLLATIFALSLGGYLLSIIGVIILKPFNIYFENTYFRQPYLLSSLNKLFFYKTIEDDPANLIKGVIFWSILSYWLKLEILKGLFEFLKLMFK